MACTVDRDHRSLAVSSMNHEDQDPLGDQFPAFRHDYPYRQIFYRSMVWRYRTGGAADRPTVLVLPGATLVPDPLFVVVQALGRQYRVIAPAYPPATTMDDLVAGVTAILDAEQVSTVHLVGSSFGGYLAQAWYAPTRSVSTAWSSPKAGSGTSSVPFPSQRCTPCSVWHQPGWCAHSPGVPGRHSSPTSVRTSSFGWPCSVTFSTTN
jgi:hypothetical protein